MHIYCMNISGVSNLRRRRPWARGGAVLDLADYMERTEENKKRKAEKVEGNAARVSSASESLEQPGKRRRVDVARKGGGLRVVGAQANSVWAMVRKSRQGDVFSRTKVVRFLEQKGKPGRYNFVEVGTVGTLEGVERREIQKGNCVYSPFYTREREDPYVYDVGCILVGSKNKKLLAQAVLDKAYDFLKENTVGSREFDPWEEIEINGEIGTVYEHWDRCYKDEEGCSFCDTQVLKASQDSEGRWRFRSLGRVFELEEESLMEFAGEDFAYSSQYRVIDGEAVGCLVVGTRSMQVLYEGVLERLLRRKVSA